MLSPVFWLALAAVFLGLRWLADGFGSLFEVEIHKRRGAPASRSESNRDVLERAA